MAHAKLSPSSSQRWMSCPASVRMLKDVPSPPSSIYANEGSIAHLLAEIYLKKEERVPESSIGNTLNLYNGFNMKITAEMRIAVNQYINYVLDHYDNCSSSAILRIEKRVSYSELVPGGFGTADAIIIDGDEVSVFDLKYGVGEKVYAKNNSQAQLYALGVLQSYPNYKFQEVSLHICQPRLDHMDAWWLSVGKLREFGEVVKKQAALALTDDAPFGPSKKACRWCGVSSTCNALAKHSFEKIVDGFDTLEEVLENDTKLVPPENLSPEQVSIVLDRIPLIEKWCKIVKEKALSDLKEGKQVINYDLKEGRSIRVWNKKGENEIVKFLEEDEAWLETKLVSPAQAEKILKLKEMKLPESWTDKKPGNLVLKKVK